MSIKFTELGRHEAYIRLYNILISLPIAKDDADEYLQFERKLTATLINTWSETYNKALKEIFSKIPSQIGSDALKIITESLDKILGQEMGAVDLVREAFRKYIQETYDKAKKEFSVHSALSLSDKRAIDILTKHNCFWLGEHYSKHVGSKISEIAQQAIDEGLGRKELAENLRIELGSDYKYWDVVSSSAIVRARSFGAISGMEEAGISEYERITPACAGKRLPIAKDDADE